MFISPLTSDFMNNLIDEDILFKKSSQKIQKETVLKS